MNRTANLVYLIVAVMAFTPLADGAGRRVHPTRPNVVFFIADDMDADMLNYRPEGKGQNLTPHLDKLVVEGTVFRNQQIPSSVCTPSRFSCLTGLYANRSPITRKDNLCRQANMNLVAWTAMLDAQTPTLPKMLQEAGYLTGMTGWHSNQLSNMIIFIYKNVSLKTECKNK